MYMKIVQVSLRGGKWSVPHSWEYSTIAQQLLKTMISIVWKEPMTEVGKKVSMEGDSKIHLYFWKKTNFKKFTLPVKFLY